ncbi:hypothetical protein ACLM5H_21310 [Fredinandcohnia humi]
MKKDSKKIVGYVIYTLGFVVLLTIVGHRFYVLNNKFSETFRPFPWSVLKTLLYISIGVYIGLPKCIKEVKKSGKWKINYYKLLFVGVPLFYFSLFWYFPFSYPIPDILTMTNLTANIAAIGVGFVVIDSISRN